MGKAIVNQRLKESDLIEEKMALLNMAVESAGIGTWVFDLIGNRKYFDKKASRLLGFKTALYKRTDKEFLNCIHPEDRKKVSKQILNLLKSKSGIKTEFRVIWPDSTVKYLTAKL